MSDPVYVYVGTYASEEAAKADLHVVRALYAGDVLRTYDAAVVVREPDSGRVHVRRHERSTLHAASEGVAVGALVGLLFPPAFIATTIVGAATAGLVGHLWHGISRADLKDLGEALDAGEASLVVISTTEIDHRLTATLKALAHRTKRLDQADAKAFEHEFKTLSGS